VRLLNRLSLVFLLFLRTLSVCQDNKTEITPNLRTLRNDVSREREAASVPDYVIVELSDKKLLHYYPELKGLTPAPSQGDIGKLLESVGKNESTLVNTVPSISAHEEVVQEHLDKRGWVQGTPAFSGQYRYIVRSHVVGEGMRFSVGRTDEQWRTVDPEIPTGYSLVKDFALLPLHFHTFHQDAARFRYLGRQKVENREDYVIAFAQVPEKAELLGSVRVRGAEITVAYQGIAWVDPDTYQIRRMRVDLLKAKPEAGIETTEATFDEVHLPVVNKSFWLPREAVVTRSEKGGSLRERHQFSDYRILTQYKDSSQDRTTREKQ